MIKREKTRKNPKKLAARFARRQRGGGGVCGSRGVGGSTPHPLLAMPAIKPFEFITQWIRC